VKVSRCRKEPSPVKNRRKKRNEKLSLSRTNKRGNDPQQDGKEKIGSSLPHEEKEKKPYLLPSRFFLTPRMEKIAGLVNKGTTISIAHKFIYTRPEGKGSDHSRATLHPIETGYKHNPILSRSRGQKNRRLQKDRKAQLTVPIIPEREGRGPCYFRGKGGPEGGGRGRGDSS